MGNSATRWWSKWEIMQSFLAENAHMSPATRAKLLNYFSDSNKNKLLQVELAAIIDWSEPFVKATYKLEGDGPLALHCYEVIETIKAYIHASHTPNILAVAEMLSGGVAHDKHLMIDHAKQCIQPGIDYFNHQLTTTLQRSLTVFKAARLFSPQKMQDMQPSASSIDSLSTFPFFDEEDLGRLNSELPIHFSKAVDLDASIGPLQWWQHNDLPYWSSAGRKVVLVQPSSAASERLFSLLNASFQDQQENTLQDVLETSIMLQQSLSTVSQYYFICISCI